MLEAIEATPSMLRIHKVLSMEFKALFMQSMAYDISGPASHLSIQNEGYKTIQTYWENDCLLVIFFIWEDLLAIPGYTLGSIWCCMLKSGHYVCQPLNHLQDLCFNFSIICFRTGETVKTLVLHLTYPSWILRTTYGYMVLQTLPKETLSKSHE